MKKIIFSMAMLALFAGMASAQVATESVFVVPTAKSVKAGKGVANITCKAQVTVSDSTLNHAAGYLKLAHSVVDSAPLHKHDAVEVMPLGNPLAHRNSHKRRQV